MQLLATFEMTSKNTNQTRSVLQLAPDPFAKVPSKYKRSKTGRSSTDLVMSHILDGLVDGTFLPGQKLNAKQLSDELDVSVVPVREALHYLAGEGLVELRALKGARIPILDQDEVIRWWDIFCSLSRRAIIEAPKFLVDNEDAAEEIDLIISSIQNSVNAENPNLFIMTLLRFHTVLNSITGLKEVDEATRRLQAVYWCSFLPNYIDFKKYGQEFADHYEMVGELIKLGAGQAAFALFEFHVQWSSAIIEGETPEPGATWLAS